MPLNDHHRDQKFSSLVLTEFYFMFFFSFVNLGTRPWAAMSGNGLFGP